MPAFAYVAVDAQGRTRRGIVEAEAPRQARAGLRSAGLVAVELAPVGEEGSVASGGGLFSAGARVPAGELALLTRRFAMLLEAGLTVERCLDALVEQAERPATGAVLAAVRAEVISGHSLAAALERHPRSFPEVYRALVSAGERSGALAEIMARLAEHLERRLAMRQGAGLALLYPAVVAGVAMLVVLGLLAYVVPQVTEVYERSRQGLPWLTRALLWASAGLQAGFPLIALLAIGAALAARAAWRREATRARWHARLLRVPVAGALVRASDTARLAGTLSILVGAGVPLVQALGAAARTLRLLPLRAAVEDAARQVSEGSTLQRALASGAMFPPMFLHLVASGEASGRLAQALAQAARQQETESETRLRVLAGILEPAIIVAMGVLVLLIVLAILMPIIQLNQLIRL